MGEVDLVFGFCVYYTKNPEQRRAQQRDRETERQRDRETERQRDRETEKERVRLKEREGERADNKNHRQRLTLLYK